MKIVLWKTGMPESELESLRDMVARSDAHFLGVVQRHLISVNDGKSYKFTDYDVELGTRDLFQTRQNCENEWAIDNGRLTLTCTSTTDVAHHSDLIWFFRFKDDCYRDEIVNLFDIDITHWPLITEYTDPVSVSFAPGEIRIE